LAVARRLVAWVLAALAALLGLLAAATPASAHSVSGVGATNWQTVLTSVSPALPGLTLRVVENGSQLELVNHGPEVLVYGYEGEPYLRVGPKGVDINTRSPAAYLNCSRTGCPVPANADASSPPVWQQISTGQAILWHDHRTHWMGKQPPPDVAANPGVRHVQATWTVTLARGSTPVSAHGYYVWVPGPGAFPWLIVVLALALGAVAAALSRSWRWLAALTAVVAAVDLAHAVVVAWFWTGTTVFKVAELFDGSSYQIPGWILGIAATRLLWRRQGLGRTLAVVVGASAVLFTGIFDAAVLDRPFAPFDGSIVVDRICVAICLGAGAGLVVGAVALLRADRSRVVYVDDEEPALGGDADGVAVEAVV
jgi:hypothetical protein